MKGLLIFILLIVNIPVYKFIFKMFFPNDGDFDEAVKYSFTPDLFSLFRGEYMKDRMNEAKLGFFITCNVIVVAIEYFIISGILSIFI